MNERFDARRFVASLPQRPGVYRMFGSDGELLYVGKARSLRDRVGSYFNPGNVVPKVQALVARIERIEVTVTPSETEALLLEFNLIKEHRPRYNVILRDDKSFPYVHVTTGHPYPRLMVYRGARGERGRYFGPFPDASAVYETVHFLHKTFRLRNCRDSYFANRTRPCLQHQIGRCSAPCVGLISAEEYARDTRYVIDVLEGRNDAVNRELAGRMEQAAERLEFEVAAQLRDQLAALKEVQSRQIISAEADRDVDVFALVGEAGAFAVSVMLVRGGRSLGTASHFPQAVLADPPEALASFVMQYYGNQQPAAEVFVWPALPDSEPLSVALTGLAGHAVRVHTPQRGLTQKWIELARDNAAQALRIRAAQREGVEAMRVAFADELGLAELPARIECFDISHTSGEGTVASCVVFGPEGPLKKEYRRFNIEGVTPGDDYGALYQALQRRYARIRAGEIAAPDVLLIDGGAGQIAKVRGALTDLGFGSLLLVGVSKGPDRKPGQERLHIDGETAARVPGSESLALRWVQRIRDEAHRFAIAGHRRKRQRRFNESVLESIPGLGPAKRRALLRHFGGLQGVLKAGVAELERVDGMGTTLARTLYDHLHPGD